VGPSSLPERVAAFERDAILTALREASGNQTRAARALGIKRDALRYMMRKLGIGSDRNGR
jgi:transcriptional regulator with GAF, ATPase, and Fis domain